MAYNLFRPIEYLKNSARTSVLSTGVQGLFKTGNQYFIYTNVIVCAELCTGVTGDPAFSVGTNGPNYDNLLTGTPFVGLGTTGNAEQFGGTFNLIFNSIPPGTNVAINVTAAGVGTVYNVQVILAGIYMNDNYN